MAYLIIIMKVIKSRLFFLSLIMQLERVTAWVFTEEKNVLDGLIIP